MAAIRVFVPGVSCSCLLPLWRTPAGSSGTGSYQSTAFAQGSRPCEISCSPFNSEISIPPIPVGLPKLSPSGLQNQMLWGLIFLIQEPWAYEPDMVLRTLIPMGEALQCNYSPVCELPTGGMELDYFMNLRLLPIFCGSFLCLQLQKILSDRFQCFSLIILQIVVILVCL